MEIGNEKQNKVTNQSTSLGSKLQGQWRAVCGADQRFYFVNLDTKVSQWLPPTELWSSKFGLPYGCEAGISGTNTKYYINHVNKISTLEDPRSEADQASTNLHMAATRSRKVKIKRDQSLGFGFVAGSERPVVIRSVISGGPSHGKLFSNDQILKVNGKDVSEVAQERVINLIKSCSAELEIHVVSSEDLQDAKNQGQRRSSLMSRATRERRRSSPVNVRFADDMIQYIGPAELARRGSLPVLPNVLKVYLENGQTRSFHYNPRTTVQEIFTALGPKLDIKAMEYFCLVLSGPHKNQLSLLQNHEKVSEIYLNRNCSRTSWVCKLRICFLPQDPKEILEKDPVAFDYLYDQISKDIVDGLFENDLRYDLAIKLAALHMQQKATEAKHKMPVKISVKSVEKDFDGLEHFVPENIVNGVKLKDLRKVLEQQIKFNQSLAGLGKRYLTSNECKQQYLKLASELVSCGGKYFNVILYSNDSGTGSGGNKSRKARQQEATLLVSPKYGLSQMVKGKINVLCQLADLEKISEFSISFHAEGKRLLTISVVDNKDLVLLMKPLDSMDIVTFIIGYQKLWNNTTATLKIAGEKKEPLAPLTDNDIPSYAALHHVIPDTWSYQSFLQVPGSNSEHHFYLDLTKDPPKYITSSAESKDVQVGDTSPVDIDNNYVAVKRSSEDVNSSDSGEEEGVTSDTVSGKRFKVDDSSTLNEPGEYTSLEIENDLEMAGSQNKARALYSIAEESQNSNNEDEESIEDDYISQLALAEEIWRRNRNENGETLMDVSPSDSGSESKDVVCTSNDKKSNGDENREVKDSEFLEKNITNGRKNEDPEKILDSDDSEVEGEIFHVEKDTSDQVKLVQHNETVRFNETDENEKKEEEEKEEEEKEEDRKDGIRFDTNAHTAKKDNLMEGELEEDRNDHFLDINDIDFDHQPEAPSSGSLDLLADFSFTGEITPRENESLAGIQDAEDILKYNDKVQHDDDGDDDDDIIHVLLKSESVDGNPELSSTLDIDSSDGFVNISESNTEERTKKQLNDVDESLDSNPDIIFEDNCDRSSEKATYFDKKDNLDESGKTDFDSTTFIDNNLPNKSPKQEKLSGGSRVLLKSLEQNGDEDSCNVKDYAKDGDIRKKLDENDDDVGGVQLVSYKQSDEQDILEFKPTLMPAEAKNSNDEMPMDGGNHLETKDSDSSSLTSQGSWQFDNAISIEREQNRGSYFKTKNSSDDEVDSRDQFGDKIRLGNSTGTNKSNTIEEIKEFDSQSIAEKSERFEDDLLERNRMESDEEESPERLISTEQKDIRENDFEGINKSNRSEISGCVTQTSNTDAVSNNDLTMNVESKTPSPMVLFLGNDPGESQDTSENVKTDSFEKSGDYVSKKDGIDFQEFLLMDWIIPPPPGSTEELFDSDITVASPPPSSPDYGSISSPPVELNDKMFNEFKIDGLILPPPPMGCSFNSVVRIVSPPPWHLTSPNPEEAPIPNIKTSIESNRQKLDNLTLEDSRTVDEFVPLSLTQNRSSESSGSVMTDEYYSESMVSCYSLSNDSQRTSEDEFFYEEQNEVFGETEDHSVGNQGHVALFGSMDPSNTRKEFKKESINSDEVTSTFKTSQHNDEMVITIQQERTKDFDSKLEGDENIVAARIEDGENNGQKPLKEKPAIDMRNGLSYDNDYDCLDELPIVTVGNDFTLNKSIDAKPRVPDLSQKRNITIPTRKNERQLIDKDPMGNNESTSSRSNLESVSVEQSTPEKGYVRNRTSWFNKVGKSGKPVEPDEIKIPHSAKHSSNLEGPGMEQQQTLNDKPDKSATFNQVETLALDNKNPKPSSNPSVHASHRDNIPKSQNEALCLPGHLLKESEEKSSGKAEYLPLSNWSLEFESETATDKYCTPRFQRKPPTKRINSQKTHTQNHKGMFVTGNTGELSSSDESGQVDGAGAIKRDDFVDDNGDPHFDDESVVLKTSFLSAKTDTTNLTEKLKLRLQGCVDDCQNSVLKSSYLPYASNAKWKEGVHDNAVFFAADVKLLNKNAQEMNSDIIPTVKASQETLKSLVSSFVLASASQHRVSLYSVRMLAGILNDVICLYADVISKIEEAVRLYPNKSKLRSVAEKTTSMTALIASLNRTLKRL